MPTHPTNVDYAFSDAGEKPASVVDRSEVDRGIPRQRRTASDTLVEVPLTVVFKTGAIATAWEDWFYSPTGAAGGAGWFDWVHPRTGLTVQARIKGGDIGTLKPDTRAWGLRSQTRQVTYEFIRSTY